MGDVLLAGLLHTMGVAVFERRPDGAFVSVTEPPPWFSAMKSDATFPFLGHILGEAAEFWDRHVAGTQDWGPCVAFYGSWFDAFPDAHVEVHGVHIIDQLVVEEGTFTGSHNGVLHGPMGDVPPTGRSVRLDYIQVLHFRNGKHVSFNLMFDRLLMLEQLGLIPAPTA